MFSTTIACMGQGDLAVVITTEQTDLNLHSFFGSPAAPGVVSVIVIGCDIRSLVIGPWAAGSIINMELRAGARILGRGGVGGFGGPVNTHTSGGSKKNISAIGQPGFAGQTALDATMTSAVLNLNPDDGFIWGGGGGGGGGGSAGRITGGQGTRRGGGGGGGGQGWNNAAGGIGGDVAQGSGMIDPDGSAGTAGSIVLAGVGGESGYPDIPPDATDATGGDAGSWGEVGAAGETGSGNTGIGFAWSNFQPGSAGGAAGKAIDSVGTVNFVGAKNEATLVAEFRLFGAVIP